MKTRVIDSKYGGNYTDKWLKENKDNIINGVLVSEWETVILYDGNFLEPLFNGTEWVEGASQESIKIDDNEKEYREYVKRIDKGQEKYLKLCGEFRKSRDRGELNQEFYELLEDTLEPVRRELVNGQFITAKRKLIAIGSSIISQELYDRFYNSIQSDIDELY